MTDALRFVVSELDWARDEYSEDDYFRRTARTKPVASFATFEEAEADRGRREDERRATENPFRFGGASVFFQSSLDGPRLHDWLMDAGIDPPAKLKGHASWAEWWDETSGKWTAEQRAHAWAALDKVRFFAVTEERPGRKAYVIQELHWAWHDEPTLIADYEGGLVVRAFRSRAAAEAECERLNRECQAQAEHNGFSSFTRSSRIGTPDAPYLDISETIFFEVVEVDLGDDA
jgi:hypothetical protein